MKDLLYRELKVAEAMYPTENVSVGTVHKHSKDLTVLLNGRIVFSPTRHRRHMVDCMLHFNLYVRKADDDMYEAGSHDESNHVTRFDVSPQIAITEMAYTLVC